LWNREVGCGYSGVIAVGNRVYTQAQILTEQKVLALDAYFWMLLTFSLYFWASSGLMLWRTMVHG